MKSLAVLSCIAFLTFIGGRYNPVGAQNICTNGTFETYTSLPSTYSQCCFATGWSSPSGICALVVGTGSPEYYHTSGSGGAQSPNTFWATVSPHTGNGFEGICGWYPSGFREYIQRQLASPMVIGQAYNVTFWWTNGVSTLHGYGCNNLAAAFSTTALVQSVGNNIPYTPQCESSSVLFSTTWQQISFTFTPAAAYQYICLGNFRTNAGTTATLIGPGTSGAYYYLDDVVVSPVAVLPLSVHDFQGQAVAGKNQISWRCESPENESAFILERSVDALTFENLGEIAPSTELSYSFADAQPLPGQNYYRLRVMGKDGSVSFTETLKIENESSIAFTIHQVPDQSTLIIMTQCSKEAQTGELLLQDLSGETVYSAQVLCGEPVEIPTHSFNEGIYFLTLQSDGEQLTQKVLLH